MSQYTKRQQTNRDVDVSRQQTNSVRQRTKSQRRRRLTVCIIDVASYEALRHGPLDFQVQNNMFFQFTLEPAQSLTETVRFSLQRNIFLFSVLFRVSFLCDK